MADVKMVKCDFCGTVVERDKSGGWIFLDEIRRRAESGARSANTRSVSVLKGKDYCELECLISELQLIPKGAKKA